MQEGTENSIWGGEKLRRKEIGIKRKYEELYNETENLKKTDIGGNSLFGRRR